ncbi:ribonuclease H-like domain-containing protein [Tanacetum coccineum]
MDLETAQITTTAKLPTLKQENENSFKPAAKTITNADGTSTTLILGPVTIEEKVQKKNDTKARKDLSLKFLRSLPSEWNTHVVVWRNKPDLDTMSFDDIYNNFKIVKQEVKGTASSSSNSQNMAFVSSPSSTNEVNTAYGVSTSNTQVSPASTQDSTASTQKTGRKITINGSDTAGYDKSKVECFNCHKMDNFVRKCRGPRNQDNRNKNQDSSRRTINVEETSSKAMLGFDGVGFDWSYMADDEVPTNIALMDFSDSELEKLKQEKESNQLKIENFDNASKSLDKLIGSQIPDKSRKGLGFGSYNDVPPPPTGLFSPPNLDLSNSILEEFQQLEFEGYGPKTSKSVSENISNEVRESLDALLVKELVLDDKSQSPMENQRNWNNQKSQQLGSDFVMYNKACFICGSFDHVQANCDYHQRERVVSENNYTRMNYNYSAKKAHPSAHRNMVPRAVLMKTGPRSLNTDRPVNTAHPKTTVYSARPMSHFSKSAQSTIKMPYQIKTSLTNKKFSQKVNTAKGSFYTARPKAVNTTRPNSAVVNAVRENQGHPQKEDQGDVDSGCSRHMIGNMSYLLDFKEFDGGYVTFRGGAKGGKITDKGTLKTGKLDFKDVYFVKELQFNLFSVSQMCDKKNSVLFTDTGCFVLSLDFKLADESQVLLKVPRKNNMYSVDMKNIIPKESLTCLVAKATLDKSMLWHKRLGHVNFKTINKLVKDNLVRGLPAKHFENDQTCITYLKGKQHKASSSKDETSGILKSFITEIENLVDKKKGIKREFSVARTPQQNGIAERRNRTLIEAAKTMLADSKLPTTFWAEAVNTTCYVQNRVLVVKPYNKTPYELFRGRTPALGFMRPFVCHVTILNTLDYLGKFDGKSDEGFFVRYSLNSKAFRVYNIRTRKVEENLHIRFLEDKPIIACDGPKWLFDIDVLTKSMNYLPVVAGTNSNDSNASNDEPQPSSDAGKKDDEDLEAVPADYVPAGHVLISADRYRIC